MHCPRHVAASGAHAGSRRAGLGRSPTAPILGDPRTLRPHARYARTVDVRPASDRASPGVDDASALPGPYAVGVYAAALRERLREFARVRVIGEMANLRPRRGRASTSSCATPTARSPARCGETTGSAWPRDAAIARRRAGDRRRRLRLLPRQRERVARVQLHGQELRVAGEGDLLAQIERRRRALAADGLLDRQRALPRALLPRTIGIVCAEAGKARDDLVAALDRRGWAGRSSGPSRRYRTTARPRGSARRCASSRRAAGRGDRHHPRRRLADRPARVLRRAALPHGRAAAGPGDRLDRPPHRPHAARRRRRRELLDADPRGRGGGAARLRRGRARSCSRRPPAAPPRRARRSSPARGCWPRSRARPAAHLERQRRSLHQTLRELRAASRRRVGRRARATLRRASALERLRDGARRDCAVRRRAELKRLLLALAAHDPQRTLARGYALVEDRASGDPVVTAAAARRAGELRLRFADDAVAARIDE